MKPSLLIAAVLILLLGLVHSVLGERYILVRLFRRDNLPRLFGSDAFTKNTLRFAWHLTTVVWFGIAALLFHLASGRPLGTPELGATLAITAAASGLVALAGSRGRHPAWIVFLVVAALVWTGTSFALTTPTASVCITDRTMLAQAYKGSHHNCMDVLTVTAGGRRYVINGPDTAISHVDQTKFRRPATLTVFEGATMVAGPITMTTIACNSTSSGDRKCRSGGPCAGQPD